MKIRSDPIKADRRVIRMTQELTENGKREALKLTSGINKRDAELLMKLLNRLL